MRHRPLTGQFSGAWATRTAHPALIGPPPKVAPDEPVGPLDPGINQRPAGGSPVGDVGAKPRGRHRLTRSICARGCACPLRAGAVLMLISQGIGHPAHALQIASLERRHKGAGLRDRDGLAHLTTCGRSSQAVPSTCSATRRRASASTHREPSGRRVGSHGSSPTRDGITFCDSASSSGCGAKYSP